MRKRLNIDEEIGARKRIARQQRQNELRRIREAEAKVSPIKFEDEKLIVHQIKTGQNKGKILFKFNNEIQSKVVGSCKESISSIWIFTSSWDKYSMMSGCSKIIDTKYEKIPEIRRVELGDSKFRKVQGNTIDVILYEFLRDMGYEDEPNKFGIGKGDVLGNTSEVIKKLKEKFGYTIIKMIPEKSKDLGEILDKLRAVREKIFEFQKDHFELWEAERAAKRYNL